MNELRRIQTAPELRRHADERFGPGRLRLSTAGYSTSLDREHPRRLAALLAALTEQLGPGQLGLVTSPTTTAGSIDQVTTEVGLRLGVPLLHVTARDFERAARADALPRGPLRDGWHQIPKFVLPTREAYSEATAHASDALLVTGGRDATVADFANAMRLGNAAVVLVDQALDAPPWNPEQRRPADAARYLSALAEAWTAGRSPPFPEPPSLSPPERGGWPERWPERLLLLRLGEPGAAAAQIAAFLRLRCARCAGWP